MATFQARIEDYIGTQADTAALSDWLTEGARTVADRMQPQRLILYATDKTDTNGTTGIALTGGRPLSAHKSGYEARPIPMGMTAKALDGDSRHYAIASDPAWYMNTSKGYVIPGGGTIKWFGYPTVAFGDSTIASYPSEALGAVVLYAAIQGQIRIATDLLTTTIGGLTWSLSETLPTITSPSFTYTKPTFSGVYTDIATALGNQDIELAQGHGSKVNLYLQQFSLDIQDELNEFNSAVQQYQASLGEFNATVANYQAEVQKEVGRLQSVIGQYTSMMQGYFQVLVSLKEEFNRLVETL